MQEILGTRLSADFNFGAQILMLIGLWFGAYFARTQQWTKHQNTQTTIVLIQPFLIFFMMFVSYYNYVIFGETTGESVARLMMIHGSFGLLAELSALYLILRMRTELIPRRFRVSNFKLMMRLTLVLWSLMTIVGAGTYYARYIGSNTTFATAPLVQLRQAGEDLLIHAVELQGAMERGNLATSKRHAEHLLNLIEGRGGEFYGDSDQSGTIEDPGDGTGLLNYLLDIESVIKEQEIGKLAFEIRKWVEQIEVHAVTVSLAHLPITIEDPAREARALAFRAFGEGIAQIEIKAQEARIRPAPVVAPRVPGATNEPSTVTVLMEKLIYIDAIVTIEQGWTVEFINPERPKHTVTSDDDVFDSGSMSQSGTYMFTFNEAGTFPYYCRFHGDKGGIGMSGVIVVQETRSG